MSIELVVGGLVVGRLALAANLVAFAMIEQINQKVSEGQNVDCFFWGTEIKKRHQALYPDSKLVSVLNSLTFTMAASFLVLCWFVLR